MTLRGSARALVGVALLFGGATLLAAPAAAQQAEPGPNDPVRVEGLSAVQLFALAARAEEQGKASDAESIYRALLSDPEADIRLEARFRLGMMLARAGRKREAALEFRTLLDQKPDAQRVRIELAALLASLGDDAAARRELRQAQAGALPSQVGQVVDQFANALRSRKPFGASLELALVPDSNINRATDAQTLDTVIAPLTLSRDARERSGVGGRAAGQAFFRRTIGRNLAIVPRVSGQSELYRERQFDDLSASALIGLEWSPGRERVQLSGGATMRWYGGSPYARTATATLNWQHPLDRRTVLTGTLGVARTDYRLNDFQDGWLVNASLGTERALSLRSGGSLELSAVRQTAADPGYANVAGGASVLYWHEWGRTTAFATAAFRHLEADRRLFLYPERRRDTLASVGIGATFRALKLRDFAPVLRLTYERNFSSVGIYDYRRVATTIGIARHFEPPAQAEGGILSIDIKAASAAAASPAAGTDPAL